MYRFALRPLWLLSHLLVLSLVAVFVVAALWQVDRLGERRDRNDVVRERTAQPVEDITALTSVGDPSSVGDDLELRVATATGTWDPANAILVRGRTLQGGPGVWALTPLVLDGGGAVLVNRGFVPFQGVPDELDPVAQVDQGAEVTVTGLVQATQTREGLGQRDPDEGVLETVSRVDVERVDQQIPYDLLPVWLQLEQVDPPDPDGVPIPLSRPTLDEGPHLSYAVQWAIFTVIALVGYPMVVRREARRRALDASRSDRPDGGDGDGGGGGGRDPHDDDDPLPPGAERDDAERDEAGRDEAGRDEAGRDDARPAPVP